MIEIKDIIEIAKKAGDKILEIYEKDFEIEYKNNASPLTEADLAANDIIVDHLKKYNLPIISEETKTIPFDERKEWNEFWLVDPLDGTKEFIKKNGEFTVNIALIKDKKPILGVVYIPVKDITYYAFGGKSFKEENGNIIRLDGKKKTDKITIVASRSHMSEETQEYIEKFSNGEDYELISSGSSIKLCLVAEGLADIYPRLVPTSEWDTGAAHAVVNGVGKKVLQYIDEEKENELEYNKKNLLNPFFIVK